MSKDNISLRRCIVSVVGHIDHDGAAILLDSTGIANVYFPDDKKAEFTRWVWNKIQNNGISLGFEVQFYCYEQNSFCNRWTPYKL